MEAASLAEESPGDIEGKDVCYINESKLLCASRTGSKVVVFKIFAFFYKKIEVVGSNPR